MNAMFVSCMLSKLKPRILKGSKSPCAVLGAQAPTGEHYREKPNFIYIFVKVTIITVTLIIF